MTQAPMGVMITIELQVMHEGNNIVHHTEWVRVKINGEEVKRWEFGMFSAADNEKFTLAMTHTMIAPIEIEAEASCNIHGRGSAAIAKQSVAIQ